MKLTIEPCINDAAQELLTYISSKHDTEEQYFDEYHLHNLKTFPCNGTYNIHDVKITISKLGEYLYVNGTSIKKVTIVLEGEKKNINKIFEEAENLRKQIPVSDEKVNVLINNLYNTFWRVDEQITKRSIHSLNIDNKDQIIYDFQKFFSPETKEFYKKLEIPYTRIYMLHGPPGTGKTTLIHCIASHFSKNIANVDFNKDIDDRHFRESLRNVPENSIICIEDIDCLFVERKPHDSFNSSVTFSGLLNTLDGFARRDGTPIIITTNHLQTLDSALKRRVDFFVQFDYCNKKQTREVFDKFCTSDKWESFWEDAKNCKLTPNIIQKYFIKNPTMKESIKKFTTQENLENQNMYI